MQGDLIERVSGNPKYQELKSKRASFGWILTIPMMIACFGFILLVADNKELLAAKFAAHFNEIAPLQDALRLPWASGWPAGARS